MKYILFLLFAAGLLKSNGQGITGSAIVDNLPKSKLYIFAQEHNNKANTILEQELLLALNKKYNLRIDILEYAHSAAFLINQYLKTGEDSILSFINAEAPFTFIRAIKAHNDSISDDRQIRFYGVDFENRSEGKYTKKAIAIILEKANAKEKGLLYSILDNITRSAPQDLHANLERLRNYLSTNEDESRLQLGRYFIDVWLIANAKFDFTPKRDDAMVSNFTRLYKELERNGEAPLFFASFGTGHVNPNNRNGIAMKLLSEESSPIKNDVSIVGIQYINCRFDKQGAVQPAKGSLNFLCRNAVIENLASLKTSIDTISFLAKKDLIRLNCRDVIERFSGLIVVRDFEASTFWTWE